MPQKLKLFGNPEITNQDISATLALSVAIPFSITFMICAITAVCQGNMELVKWLFALVVPFITSTFAYYLGYKSGSNTPVPPTPEPPPAE